MSVPNVAHLDPQRGGCCSIFPYFVGEILELPLTTFQDYSLYNILSCDPIKMWTEQMNAIVGRHGLVSFIIHPDYTIGQQKLYSELLGLIMRFSEEEGMWLALPGEVDTWWRERDGMSLAEDNGVWVVRGRGAERASVAYARIQAGELTFSFSDGGSD
jgi:hypothetical protein